MPSPGLGQAVVAKHPDIATQSSSPDAAEGRVSPQEASASSKGSSRLRRTTSSASSSSRSQSEGGHNSRARAAVRLSQLERLKAHRQSAQAGRAAAPERQLPGYPASGPGKGPSAPGSGRSSCGVAGARQRSTSRGYLDRYAAACAASGKTASPLQPQEQISAYTEESARSGGTVRLSSAESRTGTSQEATTAAHYDLVDSGQEGAAPCVTQRSSDTALASSHTSVASQPAQSVDSHVSTLELCVTERISHEKSGTHVDAVHAQAEMPGLAQAEPGRLPSECPQAPGRAKPLPQAEPPVCSPQAHPEGSHASSASPARLRSPLPAAAGPASSAGVLFVPAPPETETVQKILVTVGSLKDVGQQALPTQAAASSLHRLVNLHAYAAAGPGRHGDAPEQPRSAASIPDLGPEKGVSLDKLRSPLTSVEEGPASQFWDVQKRVGEIPEMPAKQRPRGLPKLLAGLCSCFAPQPHASLNEPVVVNLCATPGMPGSGEIIPTVLDCSEAIPEEHSSILDSQSDMEAHPPATARSVSTDAASLRKENSSPAAAVESRPSLPKAAPDQGSLPTAPMEKQPSLPRAAQKQGSTPASQQQQQENSVYESEGACTWSPPPDKELAPFLSSTMALFDRALPGGSGHADAASQDSTISNRNKSDAPIGADNEATEEAQVQPTTEAQGSATLQTQTSLAELLQSEGESSAHTAPVQRAKKKSAQGAKEDVTKWFLPGSGQKHSLKAFLEQKHPGMPSALLDPKAPAPWRSSPARIVKPPAAKQAPTPSAKQAPAPSTAGSAGPRAGTPPRHTASPQGEGSPLHVPVYQREGSPALAALAKRRASKQTTWKQAQAWSPAKSNIAIVKGPSKHPTGAAISIACTAAPGQAAELAGQRAVVADTSASAQPGSCQDKQPPKQATPAGKRAVHATISQLHEVSQTGRTSLKPPQSFAATAQRQSAAPTQPAAERSGRVPGARTSAAGADAAKRRRLPGRAMPGQQMPHLQAAMLGPGLRTNALLESGGSMGSVQSMQASRIAMQSIGEAQRAASRDRSRSAAPTRALAGTRGSGVTVLERRVLQQYLSARRQRDKTAEERGVPSPNRRYGSIQPAPQQQGVEAGDQDLPERSSRANTGLSASLEAELRDLERHWEDLDRADAQSAAQAQPAAHATGGHDDDEELQAQKKVASVIERWESRSISADALQHMRERASASSGHRGPSADGSATDDALVLQGSKEVLDEGLTFVTLDMLEQLSSPAEKLAVPGAGEGAEHPEHSSKVSTDMESICEARTLPDSHSPLSSATSSLSQRGAAACSAEKLPFAGDSSLMAAVTAAASPSASLPQAATLASGMKPQKLAAAFSIAAEDPSSCDPNFESLDSSERSLIAAHLGTAGSCADHLSST